MTCIMSLAHTVQEVLRDEATHPHLISLLHLDQLLDQEIYWDYVIYIALWYPLLHRPRTPSETLTVIGTCIANQQMMNVIYYAGVDQAKKRGMSLDSVDGVSDPCPRLLNLQHPTDVRPSLRPRPTASATPVIRATPRYE